MDNDKIYIKVVEDLLVQMKEQYINNTYEKNKKIEQKGLSNVIKSIEYILIDYKRALKENKELKDENNFIKKILDIYMN